MSNLGLGSVLGKPLVGVKMENDSLVLTFVEGTLRLQDKGQSCCESRYMTTDADLPYYVGAVFTGVELRDAPNHEGECAHEVEFLVIHTSKGEFQMESHNEHAGYFGGFSIKAQWEPDQRS